jgi:hypothetical protein
MSGELRLLGGRIIAVADPVLRSMFSGTVDELDGASHPTFALSADVGSCYIVRGRTGVDCLCL